MVHADASSIPSHLAGNKPAFYAHLANNLNTLLGGEKNWVVNLSNTASVLYNAYRETNEGSGRGINWVGFYLLPHLFPQPAMTPPPWPDPLTPSKLWLGPFQGKPACQYIMLPAIAAELLENHGDTRPASVCASAFLKRRHELVKDVSKFKGHIACDADTMSELVWPLLVQKGDTTCCLGVLDLDCTLLDGFDEEDVQGVEKVLSVMIKCTDWW